MILQLTIDTSNAAFAEHPDGVTGEVQDILAKLAKRWVYDSQIPDSKAVFDTYGNQVGTVVYANSAAENAEQEQ